MQGYVSNIDQCRIIDINSDTIQGKNIVSIDNGKSIPFDVKRVYYLYDVPSGKSRGAHAHKELYQFIIAASGSFDVVLDDGKNKKRFTLNRPNQGLLVVPGIWRDLENFSSKSVCLVLASMIYSEEDYIREYEQFLVFKEEQL